MRATTCRLSLRSAARRHGAAAAGHGARGLGTRRDGLGFFSFTGSSRTILENGGTLRPPAVILRKAQLKTESLRSPVIFPEYVGGKLLDRHGTVDQSRVTCPRDTTSVFRRERSQPYLTRTSSRVDPYTTQLTLASERTSQSPSRPTQLVELPGSSAHGITPLHAVVTGEPTAGPGPLRPAPELLLRRTNSLPDLRKPSLSPDGAYAVPRTSHCGATQPDATAPQMQPHDDGACDTSTQSPCAKAMPNARSAGPPASFLLGLKTTESAAYFLPHDTPNASTRGTKSGSMNAMDASRPDASPVPVVFPSIPQSIPLPGLGRLAFPLSWQNAEPRWADVRRPPGGYFVRYQSASATLSCGGLRPCP